MRTPQTAVTVAGEVLNKHGGAVFPISPVEQMRRFLILGADVGKSSFFVQEELANLNIRAVIDFCKADPVAAVGEIVAIAKAGRAPKMAPVVTAMAIAASIPESAKLALGAVPSVLKTGTMFLEWVATVDKLRGWGPSLRSAAGAWYTAQGIESAIYQTLKYRNRGTWTHRDVLRKAHPRSAPGGEYSVLYDYLTHGNVASMGDIKDDGNLWRQVLAFEALKGGTLTPTGAAYMIHDFRLTHEMVPSEYQRHPEVLMALFQHMPVGATVRQLGRYAAKGLLGHGSEGERIVLERLANVEQVKKSRLHPIAALSALKVFSQGHGERGGLTWDRNVTIERQLEATFYQTFDNVEPMGAEVVVGIDTSGSMSGGDIAGVPGLVPRDAAAVMAMVIARKEQGAHFVAFNGASYNILHFTDKMTLAQAQTEAARGSGGSTDIALPMKAAMREGWNSVKGFIAITDNETWSGVGKVPELVREYRVRYVRDARFISVATISSPHTVCDPYDKYMLDMVGFDPAAPVAINDFIAGRI